MDQDCSDLLLKGTCPVLFSSFIDHWPAKHWTPVNLAEQLQGKKYRCKIAPRDSPDQVWETDCAYIEASLSEFFEWSSGQCKGDNPLYDVDRDKFSCYVDYKYMPQMFEDNPHLMKAVDWSVFGLPGRDGEDSTIWVGSAGAATPCHYDTYGFNLVAQLHGKKRWHLFPPTSDCMYPTRLPYEESSVFSEVNVGQPDLDRTPEFVNCQGMVVTLCPGDVLYVPRHWWHYVECLETAVSVNTWIEVPEDDISKLREAVTRATVSCLVSSEAGESLQDWINPNEEIASMDVNWTYMLKSLKTVINKKSNASSNNTNNKLHSFASFFKGKHYKNVSAGWDITNHEDHHETTDEDRSLIPGTVLAAKKRKHSLEFDSQQELKTRKFNSGGYSTELVAPENSKSKTLKQKESSADENVVTPIFKLSAEGKEEPKQSKSFSSNSVYTSKRDPKRIFALLPSSFKSYWNAAHGDKRDICDFSDSDNQSNLLSLSENLQNYSSTKEKSSSTQKFLQGQATEPSDLKGGHSNHSEGTSRVGTDGQAFSGQGLDGQSSTSFQGSIEYDNIDVCVLKNSGQGDNHSGHLTTHSSSSGQSLSSDGNKHKPLGSDPVSPKNDHVDLVAMRDMFFRALLHPNVVEAVAGEMLKKFKK